MFYNIFEEIYIYIYTNITNIFMYQHFVHEIFTHTLYMDIFQLKHVYMQMCLYTKMFAFNYVCT